MSQDDQKFDSLREINEFLDDTFGFPDVERFIKSLVKIRRAAGHEE